MSEECLSHLATQTFLHFQFSHLDKNSLLEHGRKWKLTDECIEAFQKAKETLSSSQVLAEMPLRMALVLSSLIPYLTAVSIQLPLHHAPSPQVSSHLQQDTTLHKKGTVI